MDVTMAERLASSADPKGLASLAGQHDNPAVNKAVAEQFGAFLMQGMMQQSDGSAIPMADGIGGSTVSSMFASEMGKLAMSGDKLGLADMLLRSMNAKQSAASAAAAPVQSGGPSYATPPGSLTTPAPAAPAPAAAPATPTTAPATPQGFSLAPYWMGNGHRPIGGGNTHTVAPANPLPNAAPVAPQPFTRSPAAAGMALPPTQNMALPTTHGTALPAAQGMVTPAIRGAVVPNSIGTAIPSAVPSLTQPSNAAGGNVPLSMNGSGVSTSPTGSGRATSAQMAAFVNELAPSLQQAATQLGVSPKILLAQAALETGWGRSVVGNNVFGVKAGASWSGSVVQAVTHEVQNGQSVAREDGFRAYPSIAAAVQDYVSLISNSGRYQSALGAGSDTGSYARGLAAGGYATDGSYAAKLEAIAASPMLASAQPAAATQLAAAQD